MSIATRHKPVAQLEHERSLVGELKQALGRYHDNPEQLRIFLELRELNDELLVGIDEAGAALCWFASAGELRRVSVDHVVDRHPGSCEVLADGLSLRDAEEWVLDHVADLSWIHPRFRWKVCEPEDR